MLLTVHLTSSKTECTASRLIPFELVFAIFTPKHL